MKFTTLLLSFLLFSSTLMYAVEKKPQTDNKENKYREIATQIKLFGEVYRGVNQRYVDDVDPKDFIEAGIEGMLETLDPYTVYFRPDNLESLEMITKGEYGGVGIEIGTRGKNRELTVISPIEDTPAARKGLKAGDVIIAVDGKSTEGFTTQDASKIIRGEAGTDVVLTIRRAGFDKPLDYTLTRANIKIHDVAYSGILEGDIGYIKLVRFSGNAGEELNAALKEVLNQNPEGLILDLRSNPGGLLPSAVAVAEQFLAPEQSIVSTKGRIPNSKREFIARGNAKAADIPLVILTNRGSASASEIVAGAIQDHDRGIIIGKRTFGKGLVQTVMSLSNGAKLKLTTARYYTPSGRLIQKELNHDEISVDDENTEDLTQVELDAPPAPSDSTEIEYYTTNGRRVYGGGGINPDLDVDLPLINRAIVEMYRRDLFFSFMDEFMNNGTEIDTVNVTEEIVDEFQQFLIEQEFSFQKEGNKEIDALTEIGKSQELGEQFDLALAMVDSLLSLKTNYPDEELRESIAQSLDREMASRLGGREWRIRSTFDEDLQLEAAIKTLKDRKNYRSILQNPTRAEADADSR